MESHIRTDVGECRSHQSHQLPSFATFVSASTGEIGTPFLPASGPGAARSAASLASIPLSRSSSSSSPSPSSKPRTAFSRQYGASSAPMESGCGNAMCSNPNPYAGMAPPSSAGDRFRDWFPGVERIPGSSPTDPRAYRSSRPGRLATDCKYSPGAAASTFQLDQPRRISLPSISTLTAPSQPAEVRRNSHVDISENTLSAPGGPAVSHYGAAPSFTSDNPARTDSVRPGAPSRGISADSHLHGSLPTFNFPSSTPGGLTPDQMPEAVKMALSALAGAAAGGDRRGSADSTSSQERTTRSKRKASAISTGKGRSKEQSGDEESGGNKRFKCPHEGCGKSYSWKENLTRHMTTWHSPMQNRCPFCKDNAMRPSFNRLDNFKEHILRHFRDRNNCRARTGFDPAAEEFYLGITEMVKQRRQQQQQQHQQQQQQTLTACQRKRLGAMNIESPGSTDTYDTGSDVASDVDGDVGMMG